MALIKKFINESRYSIKCPYSMVANGICIHNTANDAPARNEVAYMERNDNKVSFHIAIDDKEAIHCIPFNRNAFAAGDGSGVGNRKHIHVEICYSKSGGEKFTLAEKRAAKEIADILKQFGWNTSNIKKHQDFSGKYCPHRTLDLGWTRFIKMVEENISKVTESDDIFYRVIVGSFHQKSNAIAKQEELKKFSYNSFLDTTTKDGLLYYRVITNSYKDKSNASREVFELNKIGMTPFIEAYKKSVSATVGSIVTVSSTAKTYATGQSIPDWVKGKKYKISELKSDRALLSEINSWFYLVDLI